MTIRVLLAEKSVFQRRLMYKIISARKDIELVYSTRSAKDAIEKIREYDPDIILLDISMTTKDDLKAFKLVVENYPTPTIVLSDVKLEEMDDYTKRIVLRSFDYVLKPPGIWQEEIPKIKEELITKIINASKIRPGTQKTTLVPRKEKLNFEKPAKSAILEEQVKGEKLYNPPKDFSQKQSQKLHLSTKQIPLSQKLKTNILVIGASLGGPKTLRLILEDIPKDFPSPILVVQHLNHFFMRQLVASLRNSSNLNVKIPVNGEEIIPGNIYFAPGDKHMEIYIMNNKPCLRTFEGELVNFCRPSVDVLFFSAAKIYGEKTLGILLTGMGKDGVAGLKAIKEAGGKTITESEETAVLYGMPKFAAQAGIADKIVPNYKIREMMIQFAKEL